ncbi:MAG: OmpA family protein [Acidobacteria bacterium]|nr:OmpA family protein [Acidobacteriota bacterium]
MLRKRQIALIFLSVFLAVFAVGCKKEPPPPPPPPPPPTAAPPAPARPTVSLTAEPSSIESGKSATLKWSSTGATSASINQGIGDVRTSGSREVFPTQTTTYTITVKGQGGEATASSQVTVRTPPPPPPPQQPTATLSDLLSRVRDAYFDYDSNDIRADAESTLRSNAGTLNDIFRQIPDARVVVEGHCDERGTNEYNLALGDRRATAAREFLMNQGVSGSKLTTISYGEERAQCSESDESCWQRNRRAHFSPAQ